MQRGGQDLSILREEYQKMVSTMFGVPKINKVEKTFKQKIFTRIKAP
jgi:hypothetical protein